MRGIDRMLVPLPGGADVRVPMHNTWGTEGRESFTRGASILAGTCALVATSAYLGADWLRRPSLGLPTGVWVIAMVQVALWARHRALRKLHAPTTPVVQQAVVVEPGATAFVGRILAAAWEMLRAGSRAVRLSGDRFRELEDGLSARADRSITRVRPLRIGLDAGPEVRNSIIAERTGIEIEWVTVSPSTDDQAMLRRLGLDAMFCHPSVGSARIVTLEHREREAAWYDWALPRPLTYAAVFPVRVDATQITLEEFDGKTQCTIVAAMVRAAAALSRTSGRLRLSDRLVGRAPSTTPSAGVRTPTGMADRAMLELAELTIETAPCSVAKPAARAVSAWLATTDAWLDINLRRRGVEAALKLVGEESELLLRAAAVRLAMLEDEVGFGALRTAEKTIRAGSHEQIGEHLAFLQAELELGLPNPLTLGRVASGICMVCASSPRDRVAYLRGDIMDDVRHSAWLVGRDQDRALLSEVFRQMGADQITPGPWELRDAA